MDKKQLYRLTIRGQRYRRQTFIVAAMDRDQVVAFAQRRIDHERRTRAQIYDIGEIVKLAPVEDDVWTED